MGEILHLLTSFHAEVALALDAPRNPVKLLFVQWLKDTSRIHMVLRDTKASLTAHRAP
jgi:hypothetical protein